MPLGSPDVTSVNQEHESCSTGAILNSLLRASVPSDSAALAPSTALVSIPRRSGAGLQGGCLPEVLCPERACHQQPGCQSQAMAALGRSGGGGGGGAVLQGGCIPEVIALSEHAVRRQDVSRVDQEHITH